MNFCFLGDARRSLLFSWTPHFGEFIVLLADDGIEQALRYA